MAKVEIQAKQVGKNVIVVIGEKKYSRAFDTKELRADILNMVKEFNTKNTVTLKKQIIATMEETKELRDKIVADAKAKAKTKEKSGKAIKPKAVEKAVPVDAIEEAKKLLTAQGYNVTKEQPKPTYGGRRTGEY